MSTLISTRKVADIVGLSPATIRAKGYPGHICFDETFPKPFKTGKRSLRWKKNDVQHWLDSREVQPEVA